MQKYLRSGIQKMLELRTFNRIYAPLTIRFQSDKMLWKAHRKVNNKKLEFYYRPISLDSFIMKEIFDDNAYKVYKEDYENAKVLDIGAHIGLFSLLASCFTSDVIAFEPDIRNRILFDLNNKIPFVNSFCCPFAIDGTQNPETKITFYRNSGNNSCIPYPHNGNIVKTVPNVDINIYLPCDIIKMDIEGAEYDVIDSIQNLSQVRKILTFEIHYHVPEWQSRLHNIIKRLTDNGFKVEWTKKYSYNGHIFARRY